MGARFTEIDEEFICEHCGKEVPSGKTIVVPMQYIVEKLNLDLEYLTKMAKLEQYLEVIANDTAVNYASISK